MMIRHSTASFLYFLPLSYRLPSTHPQVILLSCLTQGNIKEINSSSTITSPIVISHKKKYNRVQPRVLCVSAKITCLKKIYYLYIQCAMVLIEDGTMTVRVWNECTFN